MRRPLNILANTLEGSELEEWTTKMDTAVSHTYTTNQVMQNAASSDFGITFMGDKVVFASTSNQDRPIYKWNKKPYLDLYVGKYF